MLKQGQKVSKEFNGKVICGFVSREDGDNSHRDDPGAFSHHQYGDCAVKWDGWIEQWEWSSDLATVCQSCDKPHKQTYGENNEWCENCVPY